MHTVSTSVPNTGDLVAAIRDLFEGPTLAGFRVCHSFCSTPKLVPAIKRGQVGFVMQYVGSSDCVSVVMADLSVFVIPSIHLRVLRGFKDVA